VDHFSWRWIFLVNPLIALPTIWIAYDHVPENQSRVSTGVELSCCCWAWAVSHTD
jgi:hypothetical protein